MHDHNHRCALQPVFKLLLIAKHDESMQVCQVLGNKVYKFR